MKKMMEVDSQIEQAKRREEEEEIEAQKFKQE